MPLTLEQILTVSYPAVIREMRSNAEQYVLYYRGTQWSNDTIEQPIFSGTNQLEQAESVVQDDDGSNEMLD